MPKERDHIVEERLDIIVELLQTLLALELSKAGVTQGEIGKRVHVSTAKVNKNLQGIKKK
jgi:predicted transcriptional regulator